MRNRKESFVLLHSELRASTLKAFSEVLPQELSLANLKSFPDTSFAWELCDEPVQLTYAR
jgi:hypothetical protein